MKNLLLKTNNKRNRTIGNFLEKSCGYYNQVLDRYNYTGPGLLNQVFDRLGKKFVTLMNSKIYHSFTDNLRYVCDSYRQELNSNLINNG